MEEKLIENTVDQLLDFGTSKPLSHYVNFSGNKIRYSNTPVNQSGVYAFWLLNNDNIVEKLERSSIIKGPNNKDYFFSWNWNINDENILVYVGKTTTFRNRLSQHLMLKTFDWVIPDGKKSPYKRTTSCQLRTGIEHLLSGNSKTSSQGLAFIRDRIRVSFIPLEGIGNRFFAEDLAIGKGKPWFNIDSER